MHDKLQAIEIKYEEIGKQLSDPGIMEDIDKYTRLSIEYKELKEIVDAWKELKNILSNIDNNKKIIDEEKDKEFREMAKAELDELEAKRDIMEENIRQMLIPKDPEDKKNAIVEIRAGTGGDEAGIFAGDLYRMYTRFCEEKNWKTELISITEGTLGGYKEVVFEVTGQNVYGVLKYESGVHRVQRVPETESQGRVHTSAASVAVLPEADEVDVEINDKDIKKDTYRASGAGGQHVNKTDSAVRLTHIPTGVVVECQDERSQMKNYNKALKVLRSRLYEQKYQEHLAEISQKRKTMVSTGDRSAKIRTYNFPQGRVTDHRINLTLYNLDEVINGNLQPIIDKLQTVENAEKMKEG